MLICERVPKGMPLQYHSLKGNECRGNIPFLLFTGNGAPSAERNMKRRREERTTTRESETASRETDGEPEQCGLIQSSFMEKHHDNHSSYSFVAGVDFFRAFLKNWKEVGWPLQTSQTATRKICSTIDFHHARHLVEIGAGAGALTRELLKGLSADGRLIVFEINEGLCRHLRRIEDSRLTVYNASGFHVSEILDEKADVVISGVPIATLSDALLERFYWGVQQVLGDGGCCIQLQLSLLSYPKLKRLFRNVEIAVSVMNTAPLFIYRCKP